MKKEYNFKKLKKRPGKAPVDSEAGKSQVNIRLDVRVLVAIKTEAERLGIPYQTLIGSILHQYTNDELVPKKLIDILKKMNAS